MLYLVRLPRRAAATVSDATCTALQLANFWQDVSRDLEKGRIYIPLDRAAAHGLTEKDIVEKKFDERYVELMKDLIAQTRELFDQGMPLAKMVDGKLSVDLEMFSRGGMAVLDAIEAMGYDTLNCAARDQQRQADAIVGARGSGARHWRSTSSPNGKRSKVAEIGPPATRDDGRVVRGMPPHRARGAQQFLPSVFPAAEAET